MGRLSNTPFVSIVMPTFNAEKYTAQSIESILGQSYTNFEFLIVDDGSKDQTINIVERYAKQDKRIGILKNAKNIGNWAARNRGISCAEGKYIITQDADDISKPNRIERQIDFLEKEPRAGCVGSAIDICDSNGKIIGHQQYPQYDEQLRRLIFFFSPFANPTTVIRKKALSEVGLFNPEMTVSGDLDLWFRVGSHYELRNIREALVVYRKHKEQITRTRLRLMEITANKIRRQNIGNPSYKGSALARLYVISHWLSMYFIPSSVKVFLYNSIRNIQNPKKQSS